MATSARTFPASFAGACGEAPDPPRGLIAGHPSQHFTVALQQVEVLPQMPIKTTIAGLEDTAYAAAIGEASHRWQTPFTLTIAISGEIGSSVVEFARLASLLALVLAAPTSPDGHLWQRWDAGWPPDHS